jgi:glutamate racemase
MSKPIGVFDSGVGGLTVLRALRQRMPQESYIYLGDTARLPYGTKTGDTVVRYALQAAAALVGQGIKALVIACNTASAYAIPALRQRYPHLPVIGVIEAGAEEACRLSRAGRIAIMSTESTARSLAYPHAIAALRPEADVISIPCSLLVALAEEGWTTGDIARQVVARYLAPAFETDRPDTLVLGCTHFPLLRAAIESVVGSDVTIIDSGSTAATHIEQALRQIGQLSHDAHPTLRFLATDGTDRFARVAFAFLGLDIAASDVKLIDLAAQVLEPI